MATALPTEESQVKCLRYILSQGVKEDLVERPEHWPGLHCAKHLMTGSKIKAEWLNATAYHYAKMNQAQLIRKKRLSKSDFLERLELRVDALPAWAHLSVSERRASVSVLVEEVVSQEAARRLSESKKVVGLRSFTKSEAQLFRLYLLAYAQVRLGFEIGGFFGVQFLVWTVWIFFVVG